MSGYILNREGLKESVTKKFYRQGELELMTTRQLREICRRERIVQGILNPLDKEELTALEGLEATLKIIMKKIMEKHLRACTGMELINIILMDNLEPYCL